MGISSKYKPYSEFTSGLVVIDGIVYVHRYLWNSIKQCASRRWLVRICSLTDLWSD
jgi:hypothetical protein